MLQWRVEKMIIVGVVLNDNKNGKMLGPCVHALGDTLFTMVWSVLRGRKTIIKDIIMLQ